MNAKICDTCEKKIDTKRPYPMVNMPLGSDRHFCCLECLIDFGVPTE